jgi:hypothetical protein
MLVHCLSNRCSVTRKFDYPSAPPQKNKKYHR